VTERRLGTWVAIAEIISAAAVVISLIYVGLEIRRTTMESDADIQAELLSYTHQRRYLVVENADLSAILAKGYTDPTQLTPDEMLRFQGYIELLYVAWEELFGQWNGWFVSVAERDPAFVWPMVRDSQSWHTPWVKHVNRSLGQQTPEMAID